MIERVRPKSQTKPVTSPPVRLRLFGPPQLLESENADDHDELVARLCAAVQPVDVIDEMLIADAASQELEVLRGRRFKLIRIQMCGRSGLRAFLHEKLDHRLYVQQFVDEVTEVLHRRLAEEDAEDLSQTVAHECARNELDLTKLSNLLVGLIDINVGSFLDSARTRKVEELIEGYTRHEQGAVTLIRDLLLGANVSLDDLIAKELAGQLDIIERIDRLTAIAESRRNASLREIERRRAVRGQALRRSLQEVEDAEFKMIEPTPTKGKDAA
jgi:hypothetical protein